MDLDVVYEINKHSKAVQKHFCSVFVHGHLSLAAMVSLDANLYLQMGKAEHNEEDYSVDVFD